MLVSLLLLGWAALLPPGRQPQWWHYAIGAVLILAFLGSWHGQHVFKVGSDVDIWWDHYKLAGNTRVTPEIMSAAGDCATIIVVVSPAYLRSEWCGRERNAFMELLEKRQAGRAAPIWRGRASLPAVRVLPAATSASP